MKIKDAAELTGTIVRTIRWYHREGLVAVPEVRGGRRDYQLSHVARILRARWLAQAGFTLNRVGELLERETHAGPAHHVAVTDLHAALEQVDSSIEELYGEQVGPAVVELSEDMLAWCGQHPQLMRLYLDLLPGWSIPGVRAVIMRLLMLEYRDPNQRALLHRTLDALTDMIDGGAFAPDPLPSPQEPSTAGVSA